MFVLLMLFALNILHSVQCYHILIKHSKYGKDKHFLSNTKSGKIRTLEYWFFWAIRKNGILTPTDVLSNTVDVNYVKFIAKNFPIKDSSDLFSFMFNPKLVLEAFDLYDFSEINPPELVKIIYTTNVCNFVPLCNKFLLMLEKKLLKKKK